MNRSFDVIPADVFFFMIKSDGLDEMTDDLRESFLFSCVKYGVKPPALARQCLARDTSAGPSCGTYPLGETAGGTPYPLERSEPSSNKKAKAQQKAQHDVPHELDLVQDTQTTALEVDDSDTELLCTQSVLLDGGVSSDSVLAPADGTP